MTQWLVDAADDALGHGTKVQWRFEHYGSQEVETYEAVPGESLVFGATWPGWPPGLHEVRFSEEGSGTRVAITFSGIPDGAHHIEILHVMISSWEMLLQRPNGDYVKPDWFGQDEATGTPDWMRTDGTRWKRSS